MRFRQLLVALFVLVSTSAWCQVGHNVKLLCNWNDTSAAPVLPSSQRYNDVWGFTLKGKEYAAIGSTWGTHIIDVGQCKQVASYPGFSSGVVHRDFKTYKHYLYAVADEGISTLQVFDLAYLPDSLHLVYQSIPYEFSRSHNIFVDTNTAKLYCASFHNLSSSSSHAYMRIYSIAKPDSPVYIMDYNFSDDVHDVYVHNDTAYCSQSYKGYYVVDFTKAPLYKVIGGITHYPYQGYNHSSWVNTATGLAVMADETHGMPVKVLNTKDLLDIRVTGYIAPRGTDSTSIPHNPYLIGNYAFISYYFDGFQLYDLSDPYNPRQAGWYHTYPGPPFKGYAGAWGCYPFLPSRRVLVSDMQSGLFVLDVDSAIGIHKDAHFALYPNPTSSVLNLQLPLGSGGTLLCDVFDMLGRRCFSYSMSVPADANPPVTLPLPATMPAGMYVLRATVAGQAFTARFTKL